LDESGKKGPLPERALELGDVADEFERAEEKAVCTGLDCPSQEGEVESTPLATRIVAALGDSTKAEVRT
jgi:hypothetical protein